jgi:hypothetical protein
MSNSKRDFGARDPEPAQPVSIKALFDIIQGLTNEYSQLTVEEHRLVKLYSHELDKHFKKMGEEHDSSVEPMEPPWFAELIFRFLAKPKSRDALLGDLEEQFSRNVKRFGYQRACRFYWTDALSSVLPLIVQQLKRIGVWGLLAACLKRL